MEVGAHLKFERMDLRRKFDRMRAFLSEKQERAAFLRWHMETSEGVFTWNFRG